MKSCGDPTYDECTPSRKPRWVLSIRWVGASLLVSSHLPLAGQASCKAMFLVLKGMCFFFFFLNKMTPKQTPTTSLGFQTKKQSFFPTRRGKATCSGCTGFQHGTLLRAFKDHPNSPFYLCTDLGS